MRLAYRGRDNNKEIVSGIIEAPTKRDALIELKGEQGIVTIFLLKEKKEIPALEFLKRKTGSLRTKTVKFFAKQPKPKIVMISPIDGSTITTKSTETVFSIFAEENPAMMENQQAPVSEKPQFKKKVTEKKKGTRILHALPKTINPPKIYKQKFRVPKRDIKMFFEHLALLLSSGVSISKALSSLGTQTANKSFKKIIGFIYQEIQSGNPLSYAIACFPKQFDRFSVAMVTIGETSGTLDRCLNDIAKLMDKQLKIANTIKGAMVYPIVILVVLLVMLFLGSLFFIPMFYALFLDLGMELPLLTRAVFWVAEHLYIAILAIFGLAASFHLLKKTEAGGIYYTQTKDKLLLKLPLISGATLCASMFHFSSAMALMLKNGIRVIDSLHLTADIINNIYIKEEVKDSIKLLTEGIALSEALEQQPHFSDIITNVISVGEESGRMEYVLNQISDYYSEQLNLKISMLMQYIQPAAILLVAAIAVPVIFAIFIPLLDISSGQFME